MFFDFVSSRTKFRFISAIAVLLLGLTRAASAELVITGVFDGPLSGGTPKAIEIYVVSDVVDLSIYGIGAANNGGGTDGQEFTFPTQGASAGTYIYVSTEIPQFEAFFGFVPDFTSGAASINGDDAIELFENGVVVDVFGDIDVDGSGTAWDYLDGWAYRLAGSGPDGSTFVIGNWTFSGPNAMDGQSTNDSATTPFPLGTYGGGIVVESSPIVASTTPSDGAGGVALDANISINFSEAVNTTADTFAISCTVSSVPGFVVSGGPQAYTLNPDSDLVNSETCTVTVVAMEVTDVDSDDPPDNMAADYVFSFDTANPTVPDTIVVNEIMQNPSAVSDGNGEWFELFNTTTEDIDIDLWTVADNDRDSFAINNGGPLVIPAGGFLVFSNNADMSTNGGLQVDYEYSGMFLSNGADELVLFNNGLTEVDRVEWDGGSTYPDPTGASMALIDASSDNNVGSNWCEAASTYGAGDSGTPGQVNDCGFRPVVNEVDYDQPSSDTAEFVEILNRGTEVGNLSTVELLLVNGRGGAPYATIGLLPVDLAPGEHFVVCKDAATVAVCDQVAISSIQNGAPDAVALRIDGVVVDTVSYEGDVAAPYTEGSGAGLSDSGSSGQDYRGISRLPNGGDSNRNNVDFARSCITPGSSNTTIERGCTMTGPVLEIFEIQGSGESSPYDGQTLGSNDNVVTAVGIDGFAMQTPSARSDLDVNTSDGIYVFVGGPPAVAVGDTVNVSGEVREYFGFTEFAVGSTVSVTGTNAIPQAVQMNATVPSPDPAAPSCAIEFECYEGMLVEISNGSVTGPNQTFGTDPIAEVHITASPQRTFREPGIEAPGIAGYPVWDGNPEVFELDPDALGLDNEIIPAGSSFSAKGIIAFEFGGYELWPSELDVTPAPLPSAVRHPESGELTVGSLNMFRLFATENNYATRLTKISGYIRTVLNTPDILAVQEVGGLSELQDLAARISADDASINYTAHLVEGNDIGGIDVGFLTRDAIQVDAITQLGAAETFTNPSTGVEDILHDRPPLLLEGNLQMQFGSYPIAVMNVHNRSLNSIETVRVRVKRLRQAESIAMKVQALQDADPNVRLVVTGDFNAFEFTDGYVDAVAVISGNFDPTQNLVCSETVCMPDLVEPNLSNEVLNLPMTSRYSFNFRGNAQILDHGLTTAMLSSEVRDAQYGRGNADAASILLDDDGTVDPNNLALRSSDHDGVVIFVAADEDADGVPNDADMCPATMLPEGIPSERLGVNRFADTDGDGIFDTTSSKGKGPKDSYDLGDTAGCSCEQIIEAQGLGNGHLKFGCSIGAMKNWVSLMAD